MVLFRKNTGGSFNEAFRKLKNRDIFKGHMNSFYKMFKTYSFDHDRFDQWLKSKGLDTLQVPSKLLNSQGKQVSGYNELMFLLNPRDSDIPLEKLGINTEPIGMVIKKMSITKLVESIFEDNQFFYIYFVKKEYKSLSRMYSYNQAASLNCLPDHLVDNPNDKNDEALLFIHSELKEKPMFLKKVLERYDLKKQLFKNLIENKNINEFIENYGRTKFICCLKPQKHQEN